MHVTELSAKYCAYVYLQAELTSTSAFEPSVSLVPTANRCRWLHGACIANPFLLETQRQSKILKTWSKQRTLAGRDTHVRVALFTILKCYGDFGVSCQGRAKPTDAFTSCHPHKHNTAQHISPNKTAQPVLRIIPFVLPNG